MEIARPINVLVVEDSAFFRRTLKSILESDPEIKVVGTAADGKEALERIEELRPDVVTLDIEMPKMNGLEALKVIMERFPLPVIMISSLTEEGAESTLDALHLGAVDYIPKNLDYLSFNTAKIKDEFLAKIKAVAKRGLDASSMKSPDISATLGLGKETCPKSKKAEGSALENFEGGQLDRPVKSRRYHKGSNQYDLVSIGASTGGPKALQEILHHLPKDFPAAILLIQHMPGVFTKPFAERINRLCEIEIKEAEDKDIIRPGVALLAPGGYQMRVKKLNREWRVEISGEPEEILYKPSISITMQSVANSFDHGCVGVVLTGMGSDGLEGMRIIKSRGGITIAQDKESCVVYGMPRIVIEAGVADKVVPLDKIPDELIKAVQYSLLSA